MAGTAASIVSGTSTAGGITSTGGVTSSGGGPASGTYAGSRSQRRSVALQRRPSPQSAPVRHPTHWFVASSQRGVSIGHPARIDAVHCTQRPALAPLVAHTGRSPAQSPAVQARHMRVAGSQKGVAPAQSALVAHCTQRLLVASQRGDGPVQAALSVGVHCTQRPSLAHAGEAPAQSVGRVASHARHTLRIASHTGVAPLQSGSPLQPTHTLGEEGRVEHRGASPAHAPRVSEEHATQRPALGPATAHTGVATAGQSADCVATAQGRQARTEASHTGVAAPQSAAVMHPTQAPRAASQRGRAASQAAV